MVAGKRCGTPQARASMLASGGQPTEVFHSLPRSTHHRDPARQAVQEWGWGSEEGFRASTFAAPRDEHVPPAGLGCRRRCVGRQWKPRPRKLWQTSCRAQVGIPMAPPGLPLGRWIMAGGPPGRGSVLPRLCGATMKRRVELPVAITSRPVVGEYIQTCCRRIHPDHPVYYISRRACGHDDADDSSRRLATTWDPHIYQTTLYIIYDVGPACMTTPTTHQADWQLHGTPIYIRPLHIIYHVGPAAMKAPTPELQPATHHPPGDNARCYMSHMKPSLMSPCTYVNKGPRAGPDASTLTRIRQRDVPDDRCYECCRRVRLRLLPPQTPTTTTPNDLQAPGQGHSAEIGPVLDMGA